MGYQVWLAGPMYQSVWAFDGPFVYCIVLHLLGGVLGVQATIPLYEQYVYRMIIALNMLFSYCTSFNDKTSVTCDSMR